MMTAYARWLLPLAPVVCSLLASNGLLHYFQLESYQFPGYFRTIFRNKVHAFLPGICCTLAMLGLYYAYEVLALRDLQGAIPTVATVLLLPAAAGIGLLISGAFSIRKAKKKFVFTGRIKRLYVVLTLVMLALSYGLAAISPIAILPALFPLALPFTVAIGGLLAWPIEKGISELYFRDARKKLLAIPGLTRIGVTGSYGKTSVKHILGTLLSERYPTLITPASFNTPMGVSRAIREKLTPSYQVFVGEMGARHVGDIKEMCRLVRPTIGVITSIGPQHLETFKTQERITKTKYELIEALPKDSHSFFPDDDGICYGLYQKTEKPKTLVGMTNDRADVWCEDVSVSPSGSDFTLCVRDKGTIHCQTRLLGEHNIQNILLACAVCDHLGLTLKQISHGVSKLEPVKCRLELIAVPGSFTIINDAFNSNPNGAKAALRVLAGFPKRRIVITPGMVELGEKEADYNRAFGRQLAQSADVVILIGKKRVKPILEGLREAGFPDDAVHQVPTLTESTTLLHSFVQKGDTVLYENDLPDNYQEA